MRFHVRINKETPSHTFLTIFANGANCGELCFRPDEAEEFAYVVAAGCQAKGIDYELSYPAFKENTNDPK